MWRKIHSNRDPRDTLYSEIRREFKPWFLRAGRKGRKVAAGSPRLFFGLMIVLLAVSAALSFTVFRQREKKPAPAVTVKNGLSPVEKGFSQIMQTTGRLRETLRLKHAVDSLSALPRLSASDSLQLESALDRLQHISSTH